MSSIERSIGVSIALGVLSLVALMPMHLALLDISRAESDVTLEWWAVRVAVLTILAFQIVGLWTLLRIRRDSARHRL